MDCCKVREVQMVRKWCYTPERLVSTVPFAFEVSGVPSPLTLLSGLVVRSTECLVSVLLRPSCFPD